MCELLAVISGLQTKKTGTKPIKALLKGSAKENIVLVQDLEIIHNAS